MEGKGRVRKYECGHRFVELTDWRGRDSWLCHEKPGHARDHQNRHANRSWPNDGTMNDYVRDRRTKATDPQPLLDALQTYVGGRLGGLAEDGESEAMVEILLKTIDGEIDANINSKR